MKKLDERRHTCTKLCFEEAVQIALDENRMLEVLQEHFRNMLPAAEINTCRLVRLRWRGGKRAVMQYEVTVRDDRANDISRQLLTGSIHDEKNAERVSRKLLRAGEEDRAYGHSTDCLLPSSSAIAKLNMLVQPFPHDRRLPHLATMANGVPRPMRNALEAYFEPDRLDFENCTITPVRYRAGLAAVFRVELPVAESPNETMRTVFAKVFPNADDAERTHNQLLRLSKSATALGVSLVSVIGLLPSHATMLLEGVTGPTLEDSLCCGVNEPELRTAAQGIANLNQSNVDLNRIHDANTQALCLRRVADRLRQACPDLAELVSYLTERIREYPAVSLHPTHRDLKPEHIYLTGDVVTLIDCDSMAMADPVIDPAMMLARMAALASQGKLSDPDMRTAASIFVDEYFKHAPPEWQSRLNHHYVGAIVEISVGFFGRQEPNWRRTIEALLTHGKTSLDTPLFR